MEFQLRQESFPYLIFHWRCCHLCALLKQWSVFAKVDALYNTFCYFPVSWYGVPSFAFNLRLNVFFRVPTGGEKIFVSHPSINVVTEFFVLAAHRAYLCPPSERGIYLSTFFFTRGKENAWQTETTVTFFAVNKPWILFQPAPLKRAIAAIHKDCREGRILSWFIMVGYDIKLLSLAQGLNGYFLA